MSQFFTIKEKSEGIYKEKGSKFISFAIPVSSHDDVKSQLSLIKKEFHDARHHCYAYILGLSKQELKSNDDGEPSHSAGDPILGQIKSYKLTNVLVVVVRYFGGTKLGVGGLIHAYKTAASEALSISKKLEVFEEATLEFFFDYSILSNVERLISELDINVIDRDFREECRIAGKIRKDLIQELSNKTKDLYNLKLSITQ